MTAWTADELTRIGNADELYASKTVGVPLTVLLDAFTSELTRGRWLTGVNSP